MTVTRSLDETAIQSVLDGVYQAWDAGDADAFVAEYRDDATAILPGSYRRTKADVRASMAAGFASFLQGTTSINKLDSIRFLGETAAVVVSEGGIKFPGETAIPADRLAYATWVLEKRDGAWLVVAYHNSPAVVPS
ncbi:SgcJ/EcaC family oxidoreductase [Streptomyces sp. NPDC006733]|uniref:SgcJ/EcaC family oxidoreductase n=1 Tax=Streptomyces sp. NPDC006733 TaxID=3155460 RepID=UPI0033C11D64